MKTDELARMLAAGEGAIDPRAPARRFGLALVLGLIGAVVVMLAGLGLRADIARGAMPELMFWVKLAFTASSAAIAIAAAARLSRPGARLSGLAAALAAPIIAIWLLAAYAVLTAAPGERLPLVFGQTWLACPSSIALVSIPVFVAVLWALKRMAPTRLSLAGAAAGFASGALGASVYTLHCPEVAAPFIGIWYVLGMLIPATAGMLLGPRLLRW